MKNPLVGSPYQKGLKRIVDVVVALILLVFFLPLALLVSLLIKIDSKGPVLADVPERIGAKGRKFKMYKFRSMMINAHYLLRTDPRFKKLFGEYKRSSYKLKKDPRVTNVGKFIRRHSIDEIPQLLNVLRGDMSMVGPRAYYPDELENQLSQYPHTKKLVTQVLSIKPGITGLWQVTGRSEINFDKRIMIDSDYVRHISLWKDLKIMFLTPIVMVSGKGAV